MSKGEGDPVTHLDLEAEARLRTAIATAWPTHGFLGEETDATGLDREFVWIVDPIDGTANFAADITPWGVAVACLTRGAPIAAAVFCMPGQRTLAAAAGRGARADGERIRLRAGGALGADSLVGMQWFRGETRLPFLPRILATGTRIRVQGSTVTQICDVATGRLAANIQTQGRIWDIAAPALILEEAGGEIRDWQGRPIFPLRALDRDRHYPSVSGTHAVVGQVVALLAAPPPRRVTKSGAGG